MARVEVFTLETFYTVAANLDPPSPELISDEEGNAIPPQINEDKQDFQTENVGSSNKEDLSFAPTFVKCEFPPETDVKPVLVVDDEENTLDLKIEDDVLDLKTECDIDVKEERLTPPLSTNTDHLSDEQRDSFVDCFVPASHVESPDSSIYSIQDPLASNSSSHDPNSEINPLATNSSFHDPNSEINPLAPNFSSHDPNSEINNWHTLNQTALSGPLLGTNFQSPIVRLIRMNVPPDTNNTLHRNNLLQVTSFPNITVATSRPQNNETNGTERCKTIEYCSLCGKYYLSVSLLQRHIKRVHRNATQKELNTQQNPLRKDNAKSSSVPNTMINSQQAQLRKDIANNSNSTPEKVRQPIKSVNKRIRYYPPQSRTCCLLCGKEMNSLSLKIHMLHVHRQGKILSCPQCDYTTTRGPVLSNHILTHTGLKPHTCNTCKRSFTQKHALDRHVNSKHTKAVVFPCPLCSYSATLKCLLHDHLRVHHPDRLLDDKLRNLNLKGPDEFVCEFCDRKFVRRAHFYTHMVTVHLKIDYYKCHLCDFQTTRKWKLQPHMLVHTREKPYGCEECGKRFAQKCGLQAHMLRIHLFPILRDKRLERSKGPRITCQFCGREVVRKTTLAKHIENFHLNPNAQNGCKQTRNTRNYKPRVSVRLEGTRKSERKPKPSRFYSE